jgi:hypothetical protein
MYRFAQVWLLTTSLTNVTVVPPPQISVAVTLAGLLAGTWLVHCTVVFDGQVIDGAILSKTVIV